MKTLTSSCSNGVVCRYGDGGFSEFSLYRNEICLFPKKMAANSGSLQLVSVQHRALLPAPPSVSLVPESEVIMESESEETQPQEEDCSEKVRVKFQLQKECAFGEHFLLVGDSPMLGLWDPESAVPMNWSEGHIWSAEMLMPVGQLVNFKFILKSSTEEVMWQPGPDRNVTTWQSANGIVVSEDWENFEDQKLMEENPLAEQDEELALHSSMNIVGEDSTTTRIVQGSEIIDDITYTSKEPLQAAHEAVAAAGHVSSLEKSMTIVSSNTSNPEEDFTSHGKDEPAAPNSNDTVIVAEEHEGDDGLAVTFKNPKPADMEETLITREGEPGLVPELSSPSTTSSEVEFRNEDEKNKITNAYVGVDEAKGRSSMSEFDEKQGDDQADTTEMFSDEEEEVQVQQLDHIPTHELLQSKEEFPDSEPTDNSVLENDIIFWVRKTIDKLLNYILSLASENWKEI